MSDSEPPGVPPSDPADAPPDRPLSPSAARRRLGNELRVLREATGPTLIQAGEAIQRSSATISRIESAKFNPRAVDVAALLDHYHNINAQVVTAEVRERILSLAIECRKEQWFEPFKDVTTGDMTPDNIVSYVEYEADASEIRTYESDLIPGLLQTRDYARAVAQSVFPNRSREDYDRFVEFRMARQNVLRANSGSLRLSIVVSEVALRRQLGDTESHREQLRNLVDAIHGRSYPSTTVRIVPLSTAERAAMGGPFVIFSFPAEPEAGELVYLETRSGGNYLSSPKDIDRYNSYFDSLLEAALPEEESAHLVRRCSRDLETPAATSE